MARWGKPARRKTEGWRRRERNRVSVYDMKSRGGKSALSSGSSGSGHAMTFTLAKNQKGPLGGERSGLLNKETKWKTRKNMPRRGTKKEEGCHWDQSFLVGSYDAGYREDDLCQGNARLWPSGRTTVDSWMGRGKK